jgi:PAS domain S-box-containing protein
MSGTKRQLQRQKTNTSVTNNSVVEQRLDICLSAGNIAWWEMDCKTGNVVFNENKVKMLGYDMSTFSDVDYTSFTNLLHPDDFEPTMQAMRDLLEGKTKLYDVEYRIKTKKGLYHWFYDRGSIVQRTPQGQPLIVKGVVFDITERKQAEEQLADNLVNMEQIINERSKELYESNKKLKEEIQERQKQELFIVRTKDYLRTIIDSASELIISFDMNHRLSTWNRTAEETTGYKQIEILNRSVDKLPVFENPSEINEIINTVCEKLDIKYTNIIVRTKNNDKRVIRIAASRLRGNEAECLGALFIGHDITRDLELHGKLIDGNGYLIVDEQSQSSFDLFVNLTYLGYKGMYITRSSPSMIKKVLPHAGIDVVLLSETKNNLYKTTEDLMDLKARIEAFTSHNQNSVVLFEGLHYFLTKCSFQHFIETLYAINEVIARTKSILFLRVDPLMLQPSQMAILKNEFLQLPNQRIEDVLIEDESYNILRYVAEQNQLSAVVSVKKIMGKFNIAFATASSRLASLEKNDLVFSKKIGKIKAIYLTEKGKKLLQKRPTT